jgi:hypothetical protein
VQLCYQQIIYAIEDSSVAVCRLTRRDAKTFKLSLQQLIAISGFMSFENSEIMKCRGGRLVVPE